MERCTDLLIKEAVSIRVDADVLAWLKKDGPWYQSRIHAMLRERRLADWAAQGEGKAVAGLAAKEGGDLAEEGGAAK